MLLHGNLSLFSCQGAEICSHGPFPPGNACLDSKQNLESGRRTLRLKKSWHNPKITIAVRPVVRTPCHPRPGNRSERILPLNGPTVNEIMLWIPGLLVK